MNWLRVLRYDEAMLVVTSAKRLTDRAAANPHVELKGLTIVCGRASRY